MNEEDLMWENIEAEIKSAPALNSINGLTAEQAIAQAPSIAKAQAEAQQQAQAAQVAQAEQARDQNSIEGAQTLAMIPDGAIGSAMGGAAANALTPKLEQEAMKRGATKMAPFIARHIAPRLLGGAALSGGGPFGIGLGLAAPELAMAGYDALSDAGPRMATPEQAQYMPRIDTLANLNPQMHPGQLLTEAAKGPVMPAQYPNF